MNKPCVLLVDDHARVNQLNRRVLAGAGYRVEQAETLAAAGEKLEQAAPDLILLDILMPDGSGLDFCRTIRAKTTAPILFLTVLGKSEQVVEGLQSGGDDYLVKPYDSAELLARVEARLRYRDMLQRAAARQEQIGNCLVNHSAQRVYVDGADILLKPKEFLLLAALLRERGRHLSAQALYDEIWADKSAMDIRTVKTHVYGLRGKLKKSPVKIHFKRGHGYTLTTNG